MMDRLEKVTIALSTLIVVLVPLGVGTDGPYRVAPAGM